MSKKKFSEGLDDLFKDSKVEELSLSSNVVGADVASRQAERRASGKNFATDLDALLQEAMEESLEKYESNQPDSVTAGSKSKSVPLREALGGALTGLDALIRQTIDVQELSTDETTGKRRITVAVDKSKIEQLKTIARLKNAYLKDMLVELIDQFIDEYTRKKGIDL